MDGVLQNNRINTAYMEMNFSLNGSIDPVAVYAAILSTAIAVWEYIKWRCRNHIEVRCSANMLFIPSTDKKKHLVANVTNKGQTATTITHFLLYYWKNRFYGFLNIKRESFFVKEDGIPKVIQPGEQWMGQALQDANIERMGSEGFLYAAIIHSMGKKEVLCRIKIQKEKL